jgi:hypothetical protein
MSTQDAICNLYEPQFAAIAALDRAYYTSKMPTAEDRAAYFARQEELEGMRGRLYQELRTAEVRKPPERVIFSTYACGEGVVCRAPAPRGCTVAHDVINYISVVLGRCQLLADAARNEPSAERHLGQILEAVNKMTRRLRESCPRAADYSPSGSTARG